MRTILNKKPHLLKQKYILKWKLSKLRKLQKLTDHSRDINLVLVNCLDLQEEIKMDKSSNKFITTNQHPKSNTKAFHHQLMSLLLKITNLEEAAALNFLRSHIKNPVQGSSHLNQLVTIHKKLRKLSINIYGRKITKFPSTTTILTKFNSLFSISSLIL